MVTSGKNASNLEGASTEDARLPGPPDTITIERPRLRFRPLLPSPLRGRRRRGEKTLQRSRRPLVATRLVDLILPEVEARGDFWHPCPSTSSVSPLRRVPLRTRQERLALNLPPDAHAAAAVGGVLSAVFSSHSRTWWESELR